MVTMINLIFWVSVSAHADQWCMYEVGMYLQGMGPDESSFNSISGMHAHSSMHMGKSLLIALCGMYQFINYSSVINLSILL